MGPTVLLPTDLGDDAEVAYAHALRIALAGRGEMAVVHVRDSWAPPAWHALPRATDLLRRWGMLPEDATHADFAALGVKLTLESILGRDPTNEIVDEAALVRPDLVVMQTRHRVDAVDRRLHPSVTERVARRIEAPTLILPDTGRGFVDGATGAIRLNHVMVAVGDLADQALIDTAAELARTVGLSRCHGTLVHRGDREDLAGFTLGQAGWFWDTEIVEGPIVGGLAALVANRRPDLLVVGTRGHDSLGDALLGSHAERVLHEVDVPVLVVPHLS